MPLLLIGLTLSLKRSTTMSADTQVGHPTERDPMTADHWTHTDRESIWRKGRVAVKVSISIHRGRSIHQLPAVAVLLIDGEEIARNDVPTIGKSTEQIGETFAAKYGVVLS